MLQVRDESYIKYIKRKVAYKAAYKSLVKYLQYSCKCFQSTDKYIQY